ncbi:hypothetical protein RI129_009572 [Pyrocoelia pectoralis]|uniref:MADF domain-containing protein n=1 Tax=Pyrocoelia pectoralis TaxID=417401 RepID=A0AAN7V294_9COLE
MSALRPHRHNRTVPDWFSLLFDGDRTVSVCGCHSVCSKKSQLLFYIFLVIKRITMDAEKLIEEIKKCPVLYDQSCTKYRNADYKEQIWKKIASIVEGDLQECKKKWASIRDQLRRTIQKRKKKSGPAAAKMRKYMYEDKLTFLIPHLVERDGVTKVSQLEENNDHSQFSDDDIQDVFSPESNKRKISGCEGKQDISPANQLMAYTLAEKQAQKDRSSSSEKCKIDPVDAFLGGIAPTLKTLDPFLLHEAKGQIFAIVQEYELKQLQLVRADKYVDTELLGI